MLQPLLGAALIAVSLFGQYSTAIQLWTSPSYFPTTVPAACRAALTYNITCANYLVTAQDSRNGASLVGNLTSEYCTKDCQSSLQEFKSKTRSACGSDAYELHKNGTAKQSPLAIADGLLWAYKLSCIQDTSGYCLADLYGGNKSACSDCTLKYGAVMVSSDYGRQNFPPTAYSSLLSSCSIPASSYPYDYTPFPTATSTSGTPTGSTPATPTATCGEILYVSKNGDTCQSVSKAQSMSSDRFVELNHLEYNCSSLTPGTELCIEKACTLYTVQKNQTCQDIVKGQSFGIVQLIGWNPTIHQNCDNLDSMVGRSICVSPPGGGDFTMPQNRTTTSKGLSSSMFTSWVSGETTTLGNITTSWYSPTIDPNWMPTVTTYTANTTWSSLMAERTQYCWLTGDEDSNDDGDVFIPEDDLSEECYSLYESYCDIGPEDPIPQSPKSTIPKTCTPVPSTEVPSLTMSTPTSTGVTTPTPTLSGMTQGCSKFHKVVKDEGCQSIADDAGISERDFLSWNNIDDDCTNLKYDYYVCIGKPASTSETATSTAITTPKPTQTGMAEGCDRFHKVLKDEGCQSIADDSKNSLDDFLSWNPDVGDTCTNLKYDFYVCVGKPTSTSGSATSTGITTPKPTQTGMADGCDRFHKVVKDEGCQSIADDSKNSLDDFLSWNPDLGGTCTNLLYDFYVCVHRNPSLATSTNVGPTLTTTTGGTTPTPTQTGMVAGCTAFHKVEQGEWCQLIADDSKISLKDLLAWNPDVGSDCTNLKYDFYVCVGQ